MAAAFEYWEPSIEVYKENFSHPIFKQDLTNEKESIKKIKELGRELPLDEVKYKLKRNFEIVFDCELVHSSINAVTMRSLS